MYTHELIPYGQPDEHIDLTLERIAARHPQANLAWARAETVNLAKPRDSYGHGECFTVKQTHPGSPFIRLGEVAIGDDKDEDGLVIPATVDMVHALTGFVARPNARIPGMDTTSPLDRYHAINRHSSAAELRELEAISTELGMSRYQYTEEFLAGEQAFSGWTRTREAGDSIELGAVDPDSKLRLLGCTAMRDSRFPQGGVLVFDRAEIGQLVEAARNGEFDDPGAPTKFKPGQPLYIGHAQELEIRDARGNLHHVEVPQDYDARYVTDDNDDDGYANNPENIELTNFDDWLKHSA